MREKELAVSCLARALVHGVLRHVALQVFRVGRCVGVLNDPELEGVRVTQLRDGLLYEFPFFEQAKGDETVQPGEGGFAQELSPRVGRGQSSGSFIGRKLLKPAPSLARLLHRQYRRAADSVHERTILQPAVEPLKLFIRLLLQPPAGSESERSDFANESFVHWVEESVERV